MEQEAGLQSPGGVGVGIKEGNSVSTVNSKGKSGLRREEDLLTPRL